MPDPCPAVNDDACKIQGATAMPSPLGMFCAVRNGGMEGFRQARLSSGCDERMSHTCRDCAGHASPEGFLVVLPQKRRRLKNAERRLERWSERGREGAELQSGGVPALGADGPSGASFSAGIADERVRGSADRQPKLPPGKMAPPPCLKRSAATFEVSAFPVMNFST